MKKSLSESCRPEERGYETPCWIWTRCIDRRLGYGISGKTGGGTQTAHRYVWEWLVGPVPEKHDLDHLCRQRDCVNPAHPEVVTHAENCRRGASAKLTHQQVRAIKASKQRPGEIARAFGIDRTTVWRIQAERIWAGV